MPRLAGLAGLFFLLLWYYLKELQAQTAWKAAKACWQRSWLCTVDNRWCSYLPRSVASSYEFVSQIKRFDKGTRDIFRVELVNGESYVFKPYRPKDDENDRFEYIPEDELKVYNKFRHLQGKYIPICYGIVEMNSMSGLLLEDCSEKNLWRTPGRRNEQIPLYASDVC